MVFFNDERGKRIDALTLKLLLIVCDKNAYAFLASCEYGSLTKIPGKVWSAAFDWLDDSVFDLNRMKFYSKSVQASYNRFESKAQKLHAELGTRFEGDGKGNFNYLLLLPPGSEETKFKKAHSALAKTAFEALQSLITIAKKELK